MANNPLIELKQLGQSVWLDNIRRGHILSGGLKKLIDEDGISGETSNPSIFEKAIAGNAADYADAMGKLIEKGKTAFEIADELSIEDVRMACDVFRPVYDSTNGGDGFVSIEVSPMIAHDTAKTISEAKRLFKAVNRPNVMVKIPGTPEGLPAIEECLYSGLNINITLLFSVKAYEEVAWAYIRALERRMAEDKPIDRIASVASFFVSRIDTLADKLLQDKLRATNDPALKAKIEALGGKAAIANAKMAYQLFKNIFGDGRFAPLQTKGARVQRPLWASTSTKNPNYPDTLYVDTLIAPNTINTLPMETIDAYRDHGQPHLSIEENMDEARRHLQELEEVGVSLDQVTQQVLDEGIAKFEEPFLKLLGTIDAKIIEAMSHRHTAQLGDYANALNENIAASEQNGVANRIWKKDPTLWKTEPEHVNEISIRLGWLNVAADMRKHVGELTAFANEIKKAGYKSVVLCGMGGSSLGVETCRDVWGIAPGYPELHILDTTDPVAVRSLERKIDPKKTLFVISSKSGSTTETLSYYKYFTEKAPAENFIAITDPGSGLQKLAEEKNFRRVFENPSDIGGRYSVLSYFGLVPTALMGINIDKLLERALQMMCACAAEIPAEHNPGEWLGVVLGTLAQKGRDKITFITSKDIEPFGAWVEQLIAESTGKEGKGLVPVDGEPLGKPDSYEADRVFVYLQLGKKKDPAVKKSLSSLEKIGHPIIRLHLRDPYDTGAEFFRWEFAIAVAGALIGIDAFDQPNVEDAKKNTRTVLAGQAATAQPLWENKQFAVYSTQNIAAKNLRDALKSYLKLAQPNDYLAFMAYVEPSNANRTALKAMRIAAHNKFRVATTVGFGPRFLHSTGQLHKGGANNFIGLQITADNAVDLPIPGEAFTFGTLIQAQAAGDWQSLATRDRRVLRVHLKRGTKLIDLAKEMNKLLLAKPKAPSVKRLVKKVKLAKRKK
ncbi:MAG: bifunctional transaldolase/phosoglucose isomerase [Chloroflexi bacterium]|nr:bifunctional transaldolase/phosoglucose isomerase [Chloroflexota bacterium]